MGATQRRVISFTCSTNTPLNIPARLMTHPRLDEYREAIAGCLQRVAHAWAHIQHHHGHFLADEMDAK